MQASAPNNSEIIIMHEPYRKIGLSKDLVDEVEKFLEVHQAKLRKTGIKTIGHVFERAWYCYKDYLEEHLNQY